MTVLIALLSACAFLAAFLALSAWEARRGARFFAAKRGALDRYVARAAFIVEHVDLGSYARAELRQGAARAGQSIIAFSLEGVRAIERFLSRTVRHLRMHHDLGAPSRPSARTFVQTLSAFKGHLKETRPEVPDITAPEA